jgi:hypothetical protein
LTIGVEYFGKMTSDAGNATSSCNLSDYSVPDLELMVDAANLPLFPHVILAERQPTPDSPLVPALGGALYHAASVRTQSPFQVAVVLVTGTEPKSCGTLADAAATAAVGVSVGVSTYVLRVATPETASCDPESVPVDADQYDAIASSGKTDHAYRLDSPATLKDDALSAFEAIRSKVYPGFACTVPVGSTPVDQNVPMQVTVDSRNSMPQIVPEVDPGGCDPMTGGWYYTDQDGNRTVVFCDATCNSLLPTASGITVTFGCPDPILPPHL